MAYATASDFLAAYGADEVLRSADRDGDAVEDAGVVDRAIEDAAAEVDSYLGQRYTLPLPEPTPASLRRVVLDIALYRLSFRSAERTEEKRLRYEDALRWLEAVVAGKISLGGVPEPTLSALAETTADEREWTRDATSSIAGGML